MGKNDPFVEDPFDADDEFHEELDDEEGGDEADDIARPRKRPRGLTVVHDDAAVLIVDKPAGVALQSDAEGRAILHDVTEDDDYDLPGEAWTVHPLDTDASGLLVLARAAAIRDQLRADIESGRMDLVHHAIVQAVMPAESGTIRAGIKVTDETRGRVRIDSGGKPAVTQWRALDTFINFALLECRPRSLEICQIRAHLQHAGMPLAVDKVYGGAQHLMLSSFKAGYRKSRRHAERPLIDRLSLHCAAVSMVHPASGESIAFEAPPPKDFKAAVHQLGRFGRIPKSSPGPKSGR